MQISSSKIFKILGGIALSLIVLFIGFVAALPSLISTNWGRELILQGVNATIPGTLAIDDLSLSWFGRQEIEKFSLKDPADQEVLTFEKFSTNASLFRLIFGKNEWGSVSLISPTLHLVELEEGQYNLDTALSTKKRKPKKEKKKKTSKKELWKLPQFKGDLHLEEGTITLDTLKIDPITVSELGIEIKRNPRVFHIVGKTSQGGVSGKILLSGSFDDDIKMMAQIHNFPVALFDGFAETSLYTAALGSTLSFDGEALKTKEALSLNGKIEAPNLKGNFRGTTTGETFSLDPTSELSFTVTPGFFGQVFKAAETEGWALANKADLTVKINELVIPLNLKNPDFSKMPFSATLAFQRAELSHQKIGMFSLNKIEASVRTAENSLQLEYSGEIQGKGARSQIKGEIGVDSAREVHFSSDFKAFPVELLELITDDAAYLEKILGHNIDLIAQGSYAKGKVSADLSLSSSRIKLDGSLAGKLSDLKLLLAGQFLLTNKEASIYGPSPDVTIKADASLKKRHFAISTLFGKIKSPYWDIDIRGKLGEEGEPFSFDQVHLIITGFVTKLPIEEHNASVEKGDFFIHFDGSKNLIQGKANLSTSLAEIAENRSLEARVEVKDFIKEGKLDFAESEMTLKGNFDKFPVVLLTPFVGNLDPLIGPTLDLKINSTYHPGSDDHFLTLDLDGRGTGFQASLSIALNKTLQVSQNKPAMIRWEMTPSRYQTLMHLLYPEHEPDFVLIRSTQINLNITQFTCPATLPESASALLCQSGFVGDIHFGPTLFMNRKTGEQVIFHGVNSAIQGENFSETIQLSANGEIKSPTTPPNERSGFTFVGEMLNFWTPQGKFNRSGLTVKGDLNLNYVPVKAVTSIVPMDTDTRKHVQAILGDLVNAHIYGEISQLTGPLTIDIKSSNFKTVLPLQLGGGYLTLRENVEAELTLTPAVNEIFLIDVNPLLITGAWSDHPLKLHIAADGFSVPLHDYSLKNVRIGNAVIDLGKIRVRNGGDIQSLMQFLKAKGVSPDGMMDAWFTPIYMKLENGTATYQRFDILFGKTVHIALWGKIDLVKDKVRMILGISPTTLEERFKIKGLSKRDMFQVKMRGKTSKLELDWSAASTRIGLIIARSEGGQLGNIVGGILEQFVSNLGEEPTPPPTTSPFPWEVQRDPAIQKTTKSRTHRRSRK